VVVADCLAPWIERPRVAQQLQPFAPAVMLRMEPHFILQSMRSSHSHGVLCLHCTTREIHKPFFFIQLKPTIIEKVIANSTKAIFSSFTSFAEKPIIIF